MENKQQTKNKITKVDILDWFLYMIGYTLVFLLASFLFDNFHIDTNNFGIYAFLAVIIVSILNKTIKPVLFNLTLPITGLTLGLFYFAINVFILKITDWILGSHFQLGNIIYVFFIAIFISLMNLLVEGIIVKPLIRRLKNDE